MKYLSALLLLLIATSCQIGNANNETRGGHLQYPSDIDKVFEAHGGYASWLKMEQLSCVLNSGQHQIISLKDRKVLIREEEKRIGFDGSEVWVSPATAEIENSRFYHNLYFYFYAMPFVLGDPGTEYKEVEPRIFLGKKYQGIKIALRDDSGESPKDNYILYYDPETYIMNWLMYTVTYYGQLESDQYSLVRYNDWNEQNGLLLPTTLQWYAYENDSVGEVRSELRFTNVNISSEAPDFNLFEMPSNARVAPRPVN